MVEQAFYEIAMEIRLLLMMVGKVGREEMERRLAALNIGVGGVQFWLLHMLRHQEMTMAELSRKLMLDPSTLVPMIDALERKGYLSRGRDPNDRRRNPLSLTPEGIALVASLPSIDEHDAFLHALFQMGHDKALQFLDLSRELVRHLPEGETMLTEVTARLNLYKADRESPPKSREPT